MRTNMFGRIVFALLVAGLFVTYSYYHAAATPHSFDLGKTVSAPQETVQPAATQEPAPLAAPEAPAAADPAAPAAPESAPEAAPAAPTPEPVPTVDPNSPYATALRNAAEQGLPEPPDVDIYSWELMLVNRNHPLDPIDYEPEQMAYLNQTADEQDIQYSYNQYRCPVDARIAQPLLDFATACKQQGLPVYLSSGYRSYNEQSYLYNRKIDQGYSPDQAATIVALPGTSEHQTGLVCDITDWYRELKDSSLEQTQTYIWLKDHCAEYGFVVRYPADKSGSADSVTGIIYEPWHFRYVGTEAAAYMMANNLCLEEFLALYGVV